MDPPGVDLWLAGLRFSSSSHLQLNPSEFACCVPQFSAGYPGREAKDKPTSGKRLHIVFDLLER